MICNYTLGSIETEIARITHALPDLYVRENSKNVMVVFEKQLPTVEETEKISEALKEFGTPVKTDCRASNYIAFLILMKKPQ